MVVIPSDRSVWFVEAGTAWVATNNCVVIGEALWLDMNEALAKRVGQ